MPHTREISRPTLSDEELAKLIGAAKSGPDRLILHLFAIVGPRPSELFRMKWSDDASAERTGALRSFAVAWTAVHWGEVAEAALPPASA
jgi:integrase